jgi:hypothetical protein
MTRLRVSNGPDALLTLDAERAGSAWACAFSSSDEFEAAIIQARRQAGAFGPSGRRKRVYWGCAAGALIVLLLVIT